MKKTFDRRALLLLAALLSAILAAPAIAQDKAAEGEWKSIESRWYEMSISDAKAGYMHVEVFDDGERYRTDSESKMKVGRGGIIIEITMTSSFTETHDGAPLRQSSIQDMSLQVIEQEWIFKDGRVLERSRQGGREKVKEQPWPEGGWLTPMAVDRYIAEQIEAGKREISYAMLSPDQGLKPVQVTMSYVGDSLHAINENQVIPITEWKSKNSVLPVEAREKYDQEHKSVYSELETQFGTIVTSLSTREAALGLEPAKVAAAAGNAEAGNRGDVMPGVEAAAPARDAVPELMLDTFVAVDRPIRKPHQTTTAMLRLKSKKGELPELPSAGAQRAMVDSETGEVLLAIDINDNLPASGEDAANEEYLEATTMVDAADELVMKLAERAVRTKGDDPMAKAEALRAFVHRHISRKGLATAFASASETARTRTGDCSEHGVLLAAMLRAEGIPSRVAVGLVYAESFAGAENIFGWHMWTQGLIDGTWVDFDATLPVRYSAAHVLTGVSSLADGMGSGDMSNLFLLIGNLEIDVVEVGFDAGERKDDAVPPPGR
jgi:hypothetical protein